MNRVQPWRLKNALMRDEGIRLSAYDDQTGKTIEPGDTLKGIPTIGIGRNLLHRGLTKAEAQYLLDNDIEETMATLFRVFPWVHKLTGPRQEVLVNMLFNLGMVKFVEFKRMLAAVEDGNYELAAKEMLDSKWADQVGPRADRLAAVMKQGTSYIG